MSQPLDCPTCDALRLSLARIWAERDAALAECERLTAGYKMCVDELARLGAERDAARAERDHYKAAIVAALYDGDAPMVDTLRTALDAGEDK